MPDRPSHSRCSQVRLLPLCLMVLAWCQGVSVCLSTDDAGMRAGAATSNITPDLGGEIIGGFLPIASRQIHDELWVRCIVLEQGETRIALVVCDLLGIHRSLSLAARDEIARRHAIPASHVLISATHTHSATSAIGNAMYPQVYQSDVPLDDYQRFVVRRIVDAVGRAVANLEPAEVGFGSIEAPEHLFNRRWFLKEGKMTPNPFGAIDKVRMNPPVESPDLVEPAGPTDPELSFVIAKATDGRIIGIYSAYSLHYVGDVGPGHISADYFGIYCQQLQNLLSRPNQDPPMVAILANGTSGDVNNVPFPKARPPKPVYGQMRHVAEDLASKVSATAPQAEFRNDHALDAKYRELDVQWRSIGPELMAWATKIQQNPPPPNQPPGLPDIYARRVQLLAKASPQTKLPVQAIRIGPMVIGTSPCETFAETGLEFKKRCVAPRAMMVELAHGYFGYLPTPRHFALGGYETWPGTNSLEPQASVKIIDALLEMAQDWKH